MKFNILHIKMGSYFRNLEGSHGGGPSLLGLEWINVKAHWTHQ